MGTRFAERAREPSGEQVGDPGSALVSPSLGAASRGCFTAIGRRRKPGTEGQEEGATFLVVRTEKTASLPLSISLTLDEVDAWEGCCALADPKP